MTEEPTYYSKNDTGEFVAASLPSFHDSLPEELKGNELLKDMDPVALAQGYVDLKTSSPTIPETPDGYEIPQIPEGLPVDETAMTGFKTLAHELKLTPEQVQKIVEFDFQRAQGYMDAEKQSAEDAAKEIKKNREAADAALNKEWGSAKGAKLELVAKVKQKFIPHDTLKKWDDSGLSDDPDLLKVLADIGDAMDEDRLILPDQHRSGIPRSADGRPILRYDHPTSRNRSS